MPVTHPGNPNGNLSSASTSQPSAGRTKHARSPAAAMALSDDPSTDARPNPPKRARKAINCEPCRNSKLKCDRNRPCSSCVLRGTTAQCYQGQDADLALRGLDQHRAPVDPAAEFSRIRQSLALLESHVYQSSTVRSSLSAASLSAPARRSSVSATQTPYNEYPNTATHSPDPEGSSPNKLKNNASVMRTPGMLGQQGSGGLYAGPTSAASHLISPSDREDSDPSDHPTSSTDGASPTYPDKTGTSTASTTPAAATYDHDLIALLPPVHTIDGLIEYYFEYCNWIYRTVNEPALLAAWGRFKAGQCGDRIVFATVCVLIALSARYLPPGHALLASLPGTCEELGNKYYGLMHTALRRYRDEIESPGRSYTLELVEFLLVRCHYLTFAKEDPEETWSVRGELVTIGTAMGLHRDPGKSRFEKSVAERRRWAWWHIVLLERWQAFMFGRPLSIASHHFNTQLPSYCDAALDQSGRLYLPNIALFRLAYVLGDIMDDAVSFRAVPYSSVQEKDAILMHWYDSLPPELDLDEYRIARSLASPITSVRRLGVQSVIIRTAYHHIRFTLHRPYAKVPESLETAVSAASQLIALVGQTRPDFLSNSALAVPGHMNWGPFHVFSAAMFFSFQLIMKPDQEAASLFRENIRKSMASLEQSRWMPVADKALTILQALAPLYSDELLEDPPEERERKKAQVLSLVRTLAFPYQDSPYSRSADSPSYQRLTDGFLTGGASPGIPGTRSMAVPNIPQLHGAPQGQPLSQSHTQMPVSSVRWTPSRSERPAAPPYVPPLKGPSVHAQQLPSHHHTPQISPTSSAASYNAGTYASQQAATMQQPLPQHAHFFREEQDVGYMLPADESSMWGASIGFGLSEWAQFVDVMQRPDNSRLGLMQGPAQ